MNGLRHAIYPTGSRAIAVVAFTVLLLLFIYPRPDGIIFGLLRAVFLGIVVLISLELFRDKNQNHSASALPDLPVREDPSDAERISSSRKPPALAFITNLLADTMPGFGIAYYNRAGEHGPLTLIDTAGEDVDFAAEVSVETEWMGEILKDGKFLTLSEDSAKLKLFFDEERIVQESVTLLVLPVKGVDATDGVLIIHAYRFADFQEYHKTLAESFVSALSSIDACRDEGGADAEQLRFFQRLDRFQTNLDIARSKEQFLGSISDLCHQNFTFDKLTLILKDPDRPTEAVVEEVMGYKNDFAIGARFQREDSLLWKVFDGGEPVIVDLSAVKNASE